MSLFGPSLLSMLSGAVDYNQPSVLNCTGMATDDLGPFKKKKVTCALGIPEDTWNHGTWAPLTHVSIPGFCTKCDQTLAGCRAGAAGGLR